MANLKNCIPIVGGDFNAELGSGHGTECAQVLANTHSTEETREVIG